MKRLPDGTGRDGYIHFNNGGFMKDESSNFESSMQNWLVKKDYKSSVQQRSILRDMISRLHDYK